MPHRPASPVLAVGLLSALLALASAAVAAGWTLPGRDDVAEPRPELVHALHDAADAARADAGLAPTAWDEGLARAARQHAAALARRGVLDHAGDTPETRHLSDRLALVGVPYTTTGENLAFVRGAADPATTTVQGWLDSPGHRANLLHPPFDRVGFGSAEDGAGGLYLVQVLAAAPWAPSAYAASLEPTLRRTLILEVRADVPEPVVGLLELDGRAERVTWSPGAAHLERRVAGPGPTTVRLAVDVGRPAFALDEAGEVDAAGRWQPAAAPRTWLEVTAAEARSDVALVARVRFEVDPEVGAELLVDGVHRPEARSGEGALAFEQALADGDAVAFALAETDGAGGLVVRHQVALVRRGADVAWRVRP